MARFGNTSLCSFHAGKNAKTTLPTVLFLTRLLALMDASPLACMEGGSSLSRLAFLLLCLSSLTSQSFSLRQRDLLFTQLPRSPTLKSNMWMLY